MSTFAMHNRRPVLLSVFALFVVVLWGAPAHSTTVTPSDAVTSYVVVRSLPSTRSAKLGTFAPGDQAEVLESVPSWLKVQLVNGTIGYVSKRWVIEVQAPSPSPTPSPTPTASSSPSATPSPTPTPESPTPSGSSTPQPGNQGFDPGCTLPFESIKQKHPIIDDSCSRDGTTSGGGQPSSGKLAENHAKNNFCLTGTPIDISYDELKQLQSQTEQNNVQETDLTDEATRAAKLGNLITVDGHSLGEGTLVRTVLYVLDAHPADTIDQYPNSYGESVNCYRPSAEENDVHIALGEQTHIDECLSVTAEMSPHFRPVNWTPDKLNSVGEHPVRVTGQLFYDSSHKPCKPGKPASPKRVSLWEIHPVYAFEVCTSSTDINQCKAAPESAWQTLDQFTP